MPQNFEYQFDYLSYKKRTTNNISLSFTFLIISIIFSTGLAVYFKPLKTSNYEFYFVKANTFSTYTQANNLSLEIQNSGGGGNLHYNKGYNILVNFYTNNKDAEAVCENLKSTYNTASVYTIQAKNFKNLSNLSKNQCKSVQNLEKFLISSINSLSTISLQLDKNEINFNQASTIFSSIFNDYQDTYEDFLNQFKTNSKYNLAKEYANNIYLNLQTLSTEKENLTNQKIKYLTIDIVLNFASFLNSF